MVHSCVVWIITGMPACATALAMRPHSFHVAGRHRGLRVVDVVGHVDEAARPS